MSTFRIALLQLIGSGFDQPASLAKGEAFCRRASAMGADVALFPEMWNIGYEFFDPKQAGARERWLAHAIGQDDPYFLHFKSLAAELNMAIALTYLQRWDGGARNAVSIIDRRGNVALTYAKVHTCEFDIEAACIPGDDFCVCDLDTAHGHVKVGAMICFDREFPESARMLMLKGAEAILVPNACDMEENRLGQLRARAYENMAGVALANYAAPKDNGHSVAFSPIAFTHDGQSMNTLVVEAGDREGIYLAEFDVDALRDWRKREVWGNAYRRPRRYGLLASAAVEEPFIRADATR